MERWNGTLVRGEDTRKITVERVGKKLYQVSVQLKRGGTTHEIISLKQLRVKFERLADWTLNMPDSFKEILSE